MFTDQDMLARTTVTAFLADGTHKATWSGVPLLAAGGRRVMGARWRLGPRTAGPLHFEPGDMCLELFDDDLHCNVFEVHGRIGAGADQAHRIGPRYRLKGWYINLARPACLARRGSTETITYTDWSLDYVVLPDGTVTTLDGDDYAGLARQLAPADWRRMEAARTWLEERLGRDGPEFLRRLYQDAAVHPGEGNLLAMVRHYGLPAVAHWDGVQPLPFSEHWATGFTTGQRVAEALFALDAGGGTTLLHGKTFYPTQILRLPGGGVASHEAPDTAAVREAWEETGLAARVTAFAAYMTTPLVVGDALLQMPTYVFRLERQDPAAVPAAQAEEQIDRFQSVPVEQLSTTAHQLARLDGDWEQWGRYRARQHWLAYQGLTVIRLCPSAIKD